MAAVLTPRGRGAVATIRVRGFDAPFDERGPSLFRPRNQQPAAPVGRIVFGEWGRDPAEEVVVCRRDEATIDIHCHGGDIAVRRILRDLEHAGFPTVSANELQTADSSRFAAECAEALANALTLRTANILLEQYSGTLRAAIESLRDNLPADPHDVAHGAAEIDSILRWDEFGLHLTAPRKVAILGRPNVGKSSLLNALAGFSRAIVYDEPGTTRDVISTETAFEGWPVRLLDTAGLRDAVDPLETAGIGLARDAGAAADCRLLVVDVSDPPEADDLRLLAEWPDALIVANKSDLPDAWGGLLPEGVLRVSARTGIGVDALIESITKRLVPCLPSAGTAVPVAPRQVELLAAARQALLAGDVNACRNAMDRLLQ
jgi:tRNA modification GTPase